MKKSKIKRSVWILGFISLFTDFASEMLYPITPIFLTTVLGSSMTVVGLIEGFAEVTSGLLKGIFGTLSDKIGKRSLFVKIGYTLSGIVKPVPGIFPNLFVVIFSRISDRIGKGIRTAPRDALLSSYSENNSGAIFGFHRAMDTIGAVLGPLAAILILGICPGNYTMIFLLAAVPSLAAIIFALNTKDNFKIKTVTKEKNFLLNFWKQSTKEYKILLILITIFSLVNSSDVFLILRSKNITNSDIASILGYIFYNLIYALSSYPIGIISDKVGKKKIFVLGLFIFSLVYFLFAVNNNPVIIWICFALYGLYASFTEGIAKAWISDITDNRFIGSAIGLYTTCTSLAVLIGSILAGVLWDQFGSSVPFIVSSVISLVVAVILFIK